MKKSLLTLVALGAVASTSHAILQIDVLDTLFPAGTTTTQLDATFNTTYAAHAGIFRHATTINHEQGVFSFIFDYDQGAQVMPSQGTRRVIDTFNVTLTCPNGQSETQTFDAFDPDNEIEAGWTYLFDVPFPIWTYEMVDPPFTFVPFGGCAPACEERPCTASTNLLDFGTVNLLGALTQTFTLTNNNIGEACPNVVGTIVENCPTFDVTPMDYNIAPGASQEFTVTFNGQHLGETTCDIITNCGVVTLHVIDLVAAEEVPAVFSLAEAYPNPFNPTTTIAFSVPENQEAALRVFNTNGQLVQTLVNGTVERGEHKVTFDASSLASGVYVYKLETKNQTAIKKMVLVK